MSPIGPQGSADRGAGNPSPPAHVRTIRIDAVEAGDTGGGRALRVHGVLEDHRPRGVPGWVHHDGEVIHHMEVSLTVSYPDLVITVIEGEMATHPHPGICPDALPLLQSLVGVSVVRGFTRDVNQRIGRERGCTHVTALILAMGPVVRQGAGSAFGFTGPGEDAADPWFLDSCQAWRRGGQLHGEWLARRRKREG